LRCARRVVVVHFLKSRERLPMIYLDNHATTRVDPRVVNAMLPFFSEVFGNAGSSGHAFGETASDAVEHSRGVIAAGIGAEPREIVFTSGATESNNLAIRGVAERSRRRGDHLVSVKTEHQAVLGPSAATKSRCSTWNPRLATDLATTQVGSIRRKLLTRCETTPRS